MYADLSMKSVFKLKLLKDRGIELTHLSSGKSFTCDTHESEYLNRVDVCKKMYLYLIYMEDKDYKLLVSMLS